MGRVLASLLVLTLASVASAAPTIDWTKTDAGGGIYGFEFTVHGNDGKAISFFADMDFEGVGGAVQQMKCIILPGTLEYDINSETEADMYDGLYGYEKAKDSWFGDPFYESPANVVVLTGDQPGDLVYHIEAGTGGGSAYSDAKLAYIAMSSEVHVVGTIARDGVNYEFDFITPEPATLLLIVGGAAALVLRRKR